MKQDKTEEDYIEEEKERMNLLNVAGDIINEKFIFQVVPDDEANDFPTGFGVRLLLKDIRVLPVFNMNDDVILCNFKTFEKLMMNGLLGKGCYNIGVNLDKKHLPFKTDDRLWKLNDVRIKDRADDCECWGEDR
jgi:hypothetical protein